MLCSVRLTLVDGHIYKGRDLDVLLWLMSRSHTLLPVRISPFESGDGKPLLKLALVYLGNFGLSAMG